MTPENQESNGDVAVKDYIDARMAEMQRAIDAAAQVPRIEGIPLREHVDELFEQSRRALEILADEREKTAEVLRETQHRADDRAAAEREKSAATLRTDLARQIEDTYERLREHIDQQVIQIREALVAADKLEIERIKAADERTNAVKNELTIVQKAAQLAINKAEEATEKRFESVNEWRGQSLDRERSQQEQMSALSATFLPREVAEAEFAALRRTIGELTEKISRVV